MKRISAFIITFLLIASVFATCVHADDSFSDVTDPSQPYYRAVYWAVEEELVRGFSDGTFRPDDSCTREQFVTFIYRLAGRPDVDPEENPFSDVDSSRGTFKAIMWAVEEGIIKGYSDGTFKPENTVLRQEAAIMFWRMAGKNVVKRSNLFSDIQESDPFYNAIIWGYDTGVMKGFDDDTFRPADPCLRKQIVILLKRYTEIGSNWPTHEPSAKVLEEVGNDLFAAFCWSRDIPYYKKQPEAGTVDGWANYAFENKKGDCLGKACSFCLMARELGYNAHVQRGVVPLAAGGFSDHAWVEIEQDGLIYVCDPQFEQVSSREAFMFFYGTPGTWVYQNYSRLN